MSEQIWQRAHEVDTLILKKNQRTNIGWWMLAENLYQMKHGLYVHASSQHPELLSYEDRLAWMRQEDDPLYVHLGYSSWGSYCADRNLAGRTWLTYIIAVYKHYRLRLDLTYDTLINDTSDTTLADISFEKLYLMRHMIISQNWRTWANSAYVLSLNDLALLVAEKGGVDEPEVEEQTGVDGYLTRYSEECSINDLGEVLHRVRGKFPAGAVVKINISLVSFFEIANERG